MSPELLYLVPQSVVPEYIQPEDVTTACAVNHVFAFTSYAQALAFSRLVNSHVVTTEVVS